MNLLPNNLTSFLVFLSISLLNFGCDSQSDPKPGRAAPAETEPGNDDATEMPGGPVGEGISSDIEDTPKGLSKKGNTSESGDTPNPENDNITDLEPPIDPNLESTTLEEIDPNQPHITAPDLNIVEGKTEAILFTLPEPADIDLTVSWNITTDVPENTGDFLIDAGTAIVAAGSSEGAIEVKALEDFLNEDTESFTLSLEVINRDLKGSAIISILNKIPLKMGLVSAGQDHTCFIRTGISYCAGGNGGGELATGTQTQGIFTPVLTTGLESGVTYIDSQGDNNCAIKEGGLFCWGQNRYGQIGSGVITQPVLNAENIEIAPPAIPTVTPVVGMDSGIVDVGVGLAHSCTIKGGAVFCWGRNDLGQLGGGAASTPVPQAGNLPLAGLEDNVSKIASGYHHSCAIKAGALYCWGDSSYGQLGLGGIDPVAIPTVVPGFETDTTYVDARAFHTCAIRAGALYCWGDNRLGQLGIGNTAEQLSPAKVVKNDDEALTVSVGQSHICAYYKKNELYCWGSNTLGQLGSGNNVSYLIPEKVSGLDGESIISFAAGDLHTCAALGSKNICFGSAENGAFGLGTAPESILPVNTPVEVPFPTQ